MPYFADNIVLHRRCAEANSKLNIRPKAPNVVFVYSPPKVGSTTIVTTLHVFCQHDTDVIHVHGEESFRMLAGVQDVSVNDVIRYNGHVGKTVTVLDVYRTPIEHKLSAFFETIGSHFNNTEKEINSYGTLRLLKRFNNIFLHVATEDYFTEKYGLDPDALGDFYPEVGYMQATKHGIRYVKLRLADSAKWGAILSALFRRQLRVIKDYETSAKETCSIYARFCASYHIPTNYLDIVLDSPSMKRFMTGPERTAYREKWVARSTVPWNSGYTATEFALYSHITAENLHVNCMQADHYRDGGCGCPICHKKRRRLANALLSGRPVDCRERICHTTSVTENIQKKIRLLKAAVAANPPPSHRFLISETR
jgi:hypothetical protein